MLTSQQLRQYADMKMLMAEAKAMEKDMKAVVDAEFEQRYMEDGTKTRDVVEKGEKLASLTWVPGAPAAEEQCLLVDDAQAFLGWCIDNGCVVPDVEAALDHLYRTGEMPAGCALSTQMKGGRSGYVKVTPTKAYKAEFREGARKMLEGDDIPW